MKYNETCDVESYILSDNQVIIDYVQDTESYKITAIEVFDYGTEIYITLESELESYQTQVILTNESGIDVIQDTEYTPYMYYAAEYDLGGLEEDPEPCEYGEEDV